MNKTKVMAWILILFGIVLVVDGFVLHLITFAYNKIGLSWLDSFISHAFWGIGMVIIGIWGLRE